MGIEQLFNPVQWDAETQWLYTRIKLPEERIPVVTATVSVVSEAACRA